MTQIPGSDPFCWYPVPLCRFSVLTSNENWGCFSRLAREWKTPDHQPAQKHQEAWPWPEVPLAGCSGSLTLSGRVFLPRKQKMKGIAVFSPEHFKEAQRITAQSAKGPGNVANPSEEDLGLQGSLESCPLRKVVTISPCLRPNNA